MYGIQPRTKGHVNVSRVKLQHDQISECWFTTLGSHSPQGSIIASLRPCDMDDQSSTAFLCTLTHAVKTNSYELPMCSCLLASKLIQLSQFGTFMENYPIVDDVLIQNCDFHIQYFQWQSASQPESSGL